MALERPRPGGVLARVGVEPTGDAFNSIAVDERSGRPFNPMVNAGAIVDDQPRGGPRPDGAATTCSAT